MVSKNNEAILEQVNLNLDSYLRKMMKISDTIYYRGIKKKDLSSENINKEMDILYEANKDFLISISLFSEHGEIIASYPVQELKENIDPRGNDWFKNALEKSETHFSTPMFKLILIKLQIYLGSFLSRAAEITEDGKAKGGVL